MANTLVTAGAVNEYGSTQKEEKLRVVPLAMRDRHRTHSNKHPNTTSNLASWKTKKVVRAMLVVTAVAVGVLLLMTGPSKMMMNIRSRNVVDMVVASGATQVSKDAEDTPCLAPPYGEAFSGYSCKDKDGFCAGGGEAFGLHLAMDHFETCYVSNNDPPNDRCWSHSHTVTINCVYIPEFICETSYDRCDPVGYFDGEYGYDKFGVWHVSAPRSDGSCGNPCQEFM